MITSLRKLYDKVIELSGHHYAIYILAAVSFTESFLFPIPPDVMLIPMILARRDKAFQIALICTIFSVLGGLGGYAIGYYFYDLIGATILALYGFDNAYTEFKSFYDEHGAFFVAMAGITPFPYKVITILSGIVQMDIMAFTASSAFARGVRFFMLATLLWYFGDQIKIFIEKHFGLLTILFFAFLIGGFLVLKLIAS